MMKMIKMHSAPYGLMPDPPSNQETVFEDTPDVTTDKKLEDDGPVSDCFYMQV